MERQTKPPNQAHPVDGSRIHGQRCASLARRAVAANRRELWVSVAVVSFGLFFASVPVTFTNALILSGVMLVAFFCALNAILDLDEMGVVETYAAVLWFIALAIMTPLTLYWMASIRDFANK